MALLDLAAWRFLRIDCSIVVRDRASFFS